MYDFLDKIGLKSVLEAIKGKIPTSLPANGGNADTVDGKHAENFIYPRAMLSNVDLNTILYPCSALIYGDCTNMPPVESWGTLLCYSGGTGSHVQLWATATDSSMFKRHYDGVKWSDWKEISTTPIKTDTITSNSDGTGYVWLPNGNGRKYISAIAHAYTHTNMYIDGTTGNTNLQIPDAINSAVTIDIAWIE